MSAESYPLDAAPDMESSFDLTLIDEPESTLLSRTRDEYAAFSPEQKGDFIKACGATAMGIALAGRAFYLEVKSPDTNDALIARIGSAVCDKLDGHFAKRRGATTEFGGIADPLADKINGAMNEGSLVHSGKLNLGDLLIRGSMDGLKTVFRFYKTSETKGKVNVKANDAARLVAAARVIGDIYATGKHAQEHPRFNRLVQNSVNAASLAVGSYTIARLFKKTEE